MDYIHRADRQDPLPLPPADWAADQLKPAAVRFQGCKRLPKEESLLPMGPGW